MCSSVEKHRFGWDFPGGPVVKGPPSNAGGVSLIAGLGTKVLHASGWAKNFKNK